MTLSSFSRNSKVEAFDLLDKGHAVHTVMQLDCGQRTGVLRQATNFKERPRLVKSAPDVFRDIIPNLDVRFLKSCVISLPVMAFASISIILGWRTATNVIKRCCFKKKTAAKSQVGRFWLQVLFSLLKRFVRSMMKANDVRMTPKPIILSAFSNRGESASVY